MAVTIQTIHIQMNPHPQSTNVYTVLPDSDVAKEKADLCLVPTVTFYNPGSTVGETVATKRIRARCKGTDARVSVAWENSEKPKPSRMEGENKFG